MKLAVFGGTFDPVHKGHRKMLYAVRQEIRPDHVFIMPAGMPPHKSGEDITPCEDRLEMCRIAFSGLNNVTVSDWETTREEEPSYTYNTVRQLKGLFPDAKIFLIMGSDMLMSFDTWYKADELLELCTPVCASRYGNDSEELKKKAGSLGHALFVETQPLVISSTGIRELISEGRYDEASEFLDSRVLQYIKDHELYKRS